jgi:hypothetical protein
VGNGTRWSDPATWGGTLPQAGASVLIPAGKTVVLDTATPALRGLTIQGTLVAGEADIAITSDFVYVQGGRLQIGSAERPFERRATITLTGSTSAQNPATPGLGNKGLVTLGGVLELHGRPVARTWTRLAGGDVAAGARRIRLAEAPGWRAGDEIVIATSSRNQAHHDKVVIEAIVGTEVTLAQPLAYPHWGAKRRLAADIEVDARAEVGLLTHNIVVQGDDASVASRVGGHAMFMTDAQGVATVRIANVQFQRMGQHDQLGRYPVHFHLMGAGCGGCYLRDSAVRDTIQRGIVVHDSAVTAEGNVVYDTVGHNIVVETPTTHGAVIDRNLAIFNRLPQPLFTDATLRTQNDTQPSNFWIKSARNSIVNNAAAGSLDSGFMYDKVADGPATFRNNVAHAAMGKGIETAFPTTAAVMIIYDRIGMSGDVFEDVLAYHSVNGLWFEIDDIDDRQLTNDYPSLVANRVTMMDNNVGLFARGAENRVTLNDALFVRNPTRNQYGGAQYLNRPVFVGMPGGLGGGHDTSPADSSLHISRPRLVDSAQFTPDDMSFSIFDDDAIHPRGMYVHSAQHWLATPECAIHTFTDAARDDTERFYRCPRAYGYTEVDVRALAAPAVRTHGQQYVVRSDGLRYRGYGYTDNGMPFEHMGGRSGYAAYFDAGLRYALESPLAGGAAVRLSRDDHPLVKREAATVEVSVPMAAPPAAVHRTGRSQAAPDAPTAMSVTMRPVASAAAVAAEPLDTYFYDAATRRLVLHASARWVVVRP